jgi:hypothetical protein
MVKDGKIKGFSVEGIFNYSKPMTKEEKMMEDIISILKQID